VRVGHLLQVVVVLVLQLTQDFSLVVDGDALPEEALDLQRLLLVFEEVNQQLEDYGGSRGTYFLRK
jgi:hypothetical protein